MGIIFLFVLRDLIITKELKHLRSIICESSLYLSYCTVLRVKFYHAKVVLLVIWNRWFVKILEFKCGRFLSGLV